MANKYIEDQTQAQYLFGEFIKDPKECIKKADCVEFGGDFLILQYGKSKYKFKVEKL